MEQEYRIAKGWAIFVWIILPFFMILLGVLGFMPFQEEELNLKLVLILTPILVGLEFLMVLGLIDIVKGG